MFFYGFDHMGNPHFLPPFGEYVLHPQSVTACPWRVIFSIGKDCFPSTHLSGAKSLLNFVGMEPENQALKKDTALNHDFEFSGSMLNFVGAFVPNDQRSNPKQLDSSILVRNNLREPISRLNPESFCDQQRRVFEKTMDPSWLDGSENDFTF